ncbi:aldehyde dehydrogenase family protein [Halobacteriovorax sp. JY17]|uniref:aldehyde dehydrogenase family protein n=1 Tax=Halobacteriovorax sp. JY17 TaxID=2014617 RepID=UPI000C480681|nr:aldehyde dehydrogenase family protein [Halobacteriovorax sp. JY17]PIK15179.1 MAG: aldehyde dehydrogenase [Halobacteriovorax sp. JY17]
MENQSSFINGKFSKSSVDKLIVKDKFTLKEIAQISLATNDDVEESIVSSEKAFQKFSKYSSGQRYELLENFFQIFKSNEKKLINLIVQEAGKPISYARSEFSRCVETLRFALEETRRVGGEVVPMNFGPSTGRQAFTSKFPIGPVIAISPFNFPLNLALHKIAPALASGCTIVLKPSPYTPLTSLLLGEMAIEAGYPNGVLNIIICSNESSEVLVRDERFKLLSFTGSPKVGWYLKSIAGKKKVVLELGGNASVIVDETCNIQEVAKSIAMGAFLYAGQICISTQRVFIAENKYEEFKKCLVEETSKLVSGDPRLEETIVGPIIDRVHIERILSWLSEAKKRGASILIGGELKSESSQILTPAIIEKYQHDDLINCEEIFGPVVLIKPFSSDAEAIELVNDSRFGLQAGVFSNRLDFIKKCFLEIEVGGVIVNSIPGFRVDHMPYGGVKDSGLGREGIKYAIADMTEERLLVF